MRSSLNWSAFRARTAYRTLRGGSRGGWRTDRERARLRLLEEEIHRVLPRKRTEAGSDAKSTDGTRTPAEPIRSCASVAVMMDGPGDGVMMGCPAELL
jgi:hypothetical protein